MRKGLLKKLDELRYYILKDFNNNKHRTTRIIRKFVLTTTRATVSTINKTTTPTTNTTIVTTTKITTEIINNYENNYTNPICISIQICLCLLA